MTNKNNILTLHLHWFWWTFCRISISYNWDNGTNKTIKTQNTHFHVKKREEEEANTKFSSRASPLSFFLSRLLPEYEERVDEDTIRSLLFIPSIHPADRGIYTCTALNFIGNSSASIHLEVHSPGGSQLSRQPGIAAVPSSAGDENVYIDIRIAKQMIRGISIEWYATLDHPAETWFTVHFGYANSDKRELIYIGPGINSYSVSDLMPATKYEICVTLKNKPPRPEQCIVFVTGSDITEMEQREKLIHIVVIVLAMVLAVPIGMYACTTDIKFVCLESIMQVWKNRRRENASLAMEQERQGTFDSLQAASDEGLVAKESSEDRKVRRRSEDKLHKGRADHSRLTAELYWDIPNKNRASSWWCACEILIQKNGGIVCLGLNLIPDKLGFVIFQINIMVSISD